MDDTKRDLTKIDGLWRDEEKTAQVGQKENETLEKTAQVGQKENETIEKTVQVGQKDNETAKKTAQVGQKEKETETQMQKKPAKETNALAQRNAQKALAESLLMKRAESKVSLKDMPSQKKEISQKDSHRTEESYKDSHKGNEFHKEVESHKNNESHKECVSMKEFLSLKEDVRRLKRKIASIQPISQESASTPAKQLSLSPPDSSSTPTCAKHQSSQEISQSLGASPMPPASSNSSDLYNNCTRSELQDSIGHIDKLYPAVKILLLKLFPESYIVSHSVSGKASNSKCSAKPAFDARLYGIMITTLKEKFGSSTKEITEKVHSVQKYLQRK